MTKDKKNDHRVRIQFMKGERGWAERLESGYYRIVDTIPVKANWLQLNDIVLVNDDLEVVEVLQSTGDIKLKFRFFNLDRYVALVEEAEKEDITIATVAPQLAIASMANWQKETFVKLLNKYCFTVCT